MWTKKKLRRLDKEENKERKEVRETAADKKKTTKRKTKNNDFEKQTDRSAGKLENMK